MYFKDIVIAGFLSYCEPTTIKFSEQSTILLGQNNTGKSKIFDAFNWVLFNRIFITEQEHWLNTTSDISPLILNWKLRDESITNKVENIKVTVKLNLTDDSDDSVTIERDYNYKFHDNNYSFISEELVVLKVDEFDSSQYEALTNKDAAAFISELIPEKLSRYFLFQGETVSDIMSLHKKSHFTTAITELARLELFAKARKESENVKNRFKRRIERALDENEKTKLFREQAEKELSSYEKRKSEHLEKIERLEANQELLQKDISSLEVQLSEFEGFKEKFDKIDTLKKEVERLTNQKKLYSEQEWKTDLTENWVFYKVRDDLKKFSDFYTQLSIKGEVPAPITQRVLKEAISEKVCSLCGRNLKEGSPEFIFVKSRIIEQDLDGLSLVLHQILSEMDSFSTQLDYIPENIAKERKARESLFRMSKEAEIELKQKMKEIEDSSPTALEKEKKAIDELTSRYKFKRKLLQELEQDLAKTKARVDEIDISIKNNEKQLQGFVIDDKTKVEQIKFELAYSVSEAMKDLENKITHTIYDDIQNKADLYYQEMTQFNKTISGRLVLDHENSEVYTVDEQNSRILNINQATRISIQLAFIAGILTVAGNQLGLNFPFIADAPISALDGINKLSTIRCLLNAFDQSIIILKDDINSDKDKINDPVRALIQQSDDIEYAYELSMTTSGKIKHQTTSVYKIKGN